MITTSGAFFNFEVFVTMLDITFSRATICMQGSTGIPSLSQIDDSSSGIFVCITGKWVLSVRTYDKTFPSPRAVTARSITFLSQAPRNKAPQNGSVDISISVTRFRPCWINPKCNNPPVCHFLQLLKNRFVEGGSIGNNMV